MSLVITNKGRETIAKIRLFLTVCFVLTAVLCMAAIAPAATAGAAEQQALQAVPSYVNPITGEIEDAGQNPELGQGMAENLIMRTPAILLVDSEGSIFITFRVGLVAESQDLRIQLLDAQGQAETTLPYSIVENHVDDNTQDIRIMVPDRSPTLRVSLVSIPMGREVVCFATFAPEGEAVEVPIAEISGEVDDDAIVIQEAGDEIVGVADEEREQIVSFLAIAGGILVGIAIVAVIVAARKRKEMEKAEEAMFGTTAEQTPSPDVPSDIPPGTQ